VEPPRLKSGDSCVGYRKGYGGPMKKIIIFAGIVFLVAGQIMFFLWKDSPFASHNLFAFSVILMPSGIILALAAFFLETSMLCLVLFLLFGIFGSFLAGINGLSSVLSFAVSALFLLLAQKKTGNFWGFMDIPAQSALRENWEKYFLVALFVLLFFSRLFMLNTFPLNAAWHEREMMEKLPWLEQSYTAHCFTSDVNFPTLVFYQGMLFERLFGNSIGSLRIPAGIFGLIGIISFYFLIRSLFSARTAAFSSLLFASSNLHLVQSRWFFPGTILIPAFLAGMAFIVYGIRKNKWYLFFAGGLAAGFSLHGYFPGRATIFVFALWLLCALIIWRHLNISLKNILVFFAGFAVTAIPVILFAVSRPADYWDYLSHSNPNKGMGISHYLRTVIDVLPSYAGMFHFRSDYDYSIHMERMPLLDSLTGILFPAAFFLCAALFFRPLPAFALISFCTGLLPAFLGGGFEHPTERRVILALPVIYFMAAFSYEMIKRAAFPDGGSKKAKIFFAVSLLAGFFVFFAEIKNYFFDYCGSPYEALGYRKKDRVAADFLIKEKDPGSVMLLSPYCEYAGMLMPGLNLTRLESNDDILKYCGSKSIDAALDGFSGYCGDFIAGLFPDSDFRVITEKNCGAPITQTDAFLRMTEPFADCTYLVTLRIPGRDAVNFTGLTGKDKKINVDYKNGSLVFRDDPGGKEINIAASFFTSGSPVTVEFPWKSWSISVDGGIVRPGKEVPLINGAHTIEIKGMVPGGSGGVLPLSVKTGANRLTLLKLAEPYGLYCCQRDGLDNWQAKCGYESNKIFVMQRFYDLPPGGTASVYYSGFIRVPVSGDYVFQGKEYRNNMAIKIGGKEIFSDIETGKIETETPVSLEAGKKYIFEAFYDAKGELGNRAFVVEYRRVDAGNFSIVPVEWFLRY